MTIRKRLLLNFLLSNCTWKAGELRAEFRQPFDMISADIPQGGSAFGEYSAVKPLIAFAQELEQLLMLLGQVEPHGPFAWQVEEVNADEVEELASLLTLKFQTFEAVSVIGAESNVCLFPVRKQTPTPVSSQAV